MLPGSGQKVSDGWVLKKPILVFIIHLQRSQEIPRVLFQIHIVTIDYYLPPHGKVTAIHRDHHLFPR